MGLFNKKSAKQGELQAENAELKEQLNKLRGENEELKARNAEAEKNFAEKQSALVAEIYRLNKKISKSGKFDGKFDSRFKAENNDKAEKIENAEKEEKTEKTETTIRPNAEAELSAAYISEINRLKTFISRWEKALLSGDLAAEKRKKSALTAALKQILNFNEQELSLAELSDKVSEMTDMIAGGKREEEGGIDLDEVLNPSEELDLESLCKELGVME